MKLNYKRTFFIGFAFMSICAFWQMYDNTIPKILESTFGLEETPIGVIMALDNVLAIILLPVFGALSDKTSTRFGRRTPYIVIGTLCAAALTVFLPIADNIKSFPMFIIALGFVLLSMSVYRSPAVALMPDLTSKPLRSKANSIINLMGAVGGIFTLVMITVFKPTESKTYLGVYIAVAAMMLVSIFILVMTIRERKIAAEVAVYDVEESPKETHVNKPMDKAVKKSLIFLLMSIILWFFAYNAVTSAFSRYTSAVWGDTTDAYSKYLMAATVFATLSYIPIGFLSSKLGRKKVIIGGIIMMTAAYAAAFLLTSVTPVAYVLFALIGVGWAAINVNSYPMVVEMSNGADVGKYTGLYYTFSMAAQIATPIVSGALIQFLPIGYKVLFPYAAVFSALAIVTMLFVKHGDSRPENVEKALEDVE